MEVTDPTFAESWTNFGEIFLPLVIFGVAWGFMLYTGICMFLGSTHQALVDAMESH